ncbi:MAG: T9SS type A sorting domain-containing protein [Schleiferiaceae bacterium]|nr:T9SS type A sorting domain-containing protein [Schleiferiaceae bacterium]
MDGTVGNKLRTINFGDSLYSLATVFDDFQIYMVTCYGLSTVGFFPNYCELKRIDLNTGTESINVFLEDSTQTFFMLPPKIWHNYNSSQLLSFDVVLGKFYIFDKNTLDTVLSVDVDMFQLQLDHQMIGIRAQGYNIIDGKLVVAGSAGHLLDLFSGLSNEHGFIMEFDDSLQIASVSGFGEIGFGNSTGLVGVEQMPDNTLIGLGATPFVENAASNTQREIFIAKTTAFGKDSLIIYRHGNHIGYYAIGDANGDLFVVAYFTNDLLSEPNFIEVIKVPQFALSVLEQQGVTKAINVYPNPTTDFLTLSIDTDLFSNDIYWKIFNSQGQEVLSKPLLNNTIEVKNLPTGSYVFLFEVNGEVFNTVFIKK